MKLIFKLEIKIICSKCCHWTYEDEAPHSTAVLWGKCRHPQPLKRTAIWYDMIGGGQMTPSSGRACSSFELRRRILL